MEIQELYSVGYDSLSDSIKEGKVKEDVKQAFLVYLFFINGNSKKHSQLKKTVANNMQKEMAWSSYAILCLIRKSATHGKPAIPAKNDRQDPRGKLGNYDTH